MVSMMESLITFILILTMTNSVIGECTEDTLNNNLLEFKKCMDVKKESMFNLNDTLSNLEDFLCEGLNDLTEGCKGQVTQLARCRGKEEVDTLVVLHLKTVIGLLNIIHSDINL